jgi:hypothetical protein
MQAVFNDGQYSGCACLIEVLGKIRQVQAWRQRGLAGWQWGGVVVDDTTSVLRSSGVSVCMLLRAPAAILLAPSSMSRA